MFDKVPHYNVFKGTSRKKSQNEQEINEVSRKKIAFTYLRFKLLRSKERSKCERGSKCKHFSQANTYTRSSGKYSSERSFLLSCEQTFSIRSKTKHIIYDILFLHFISFYLLLLPPNANKPL